ncbi:MAG: lamin tail domain-containing protein, partial [Akkermansiaceae bacterium]
LDAPSFSQHGGLTTPGSSITLTAPSTIHYTLNGLDPTEPGALTLSSGSSLTISSSLTLKARSFDGSEWSALNEAQFFTTIPADNTNLVITEIHYNPSGPDEGTEFIELKNTSAVPIHLDGLQFIDGITFTFPDNTVLQPGAYLLLVNDQVAFENLHGNALPVLGEFSGKLSNSGEQLILADADFNPLFQFTYNDALPWSSLADGSGPSLTFISGDPAHSENWRPSSLQNGTPGASDSSTPSGNIFADAFPNGDGLTLSYVQNDALAFSYQQSLPADHLRVVPQFSADLITWEDLTELTILNESLTPQGNLQKTFEGDNSTAEGYLRLRLEAR